MNPISNIRMGQIRPASVRLDTVAQTREKKVEQAERKKSEQTARSIQETPAAQYSQGTQPISAGEYRIGQDEDGNRTIVVNPVTDANTPNARP
ncbi:MAG: hypothetical protein IKR84_01775, partial [Oscillibacter sp.]|nr:hypothetical protein [Oscillibacter sp.]